MNKQKEGFEIAASFYRRIIEREAMGGIDTLEAHRDIARLITISNSLHTCDENSCNGYQDYSGNEDTKRAERNDKRAERLETEAQAIADKYKAIAYHQSDPRGASLYIVPIEDKERIASAYSSIGVAIY